MSNKINKTVIILEGITTSGKTTVFTNLKRYAEEHALNARFITEQETTMPYLDNTDLKHSRTSLEGLTDVVFSHPADLFVFDRLYFGHTFKTNSTAKDFRSIEEKLKNFNTIICLLEIPEEDLENRILNSIKYRYKGWGEYVMKRAQGSVDNLISFYMERQRGTKKLFEESTLRRYVIDTKNQDYILITRHIIDVAGIRPDQFLV